MSYFDTFNFKLTKVFTHLRKMGNEFSTPWQENVLTVSH